ncbi:MAG: 16S rRNA (uracil(1498)-N(3))-methyltransferase [Oscillospiraceae bacterium]
MLLPRFFVSEINSDFVTISGEDADHIAKSLRLKPMEKITLCNGKGIDYDGVIQSLGKEVTVSILSKYPTKTEPKAKITLFQALPKGDKMEYIIQKSVELGVTDIVPILTDRCISRPDSKSMSKKIARYNKISLEAAKQSGRGVIPRVHDLLTLEQSVQEMPQKSIVFYEKGGQRLCDLISNEILDLGVFIGSEGGFSEEEIACLQQFHVLPATLGTRILRCETAPICGLSVILSLTGDI